MAMEEKVQALVSSTKDLVPSDQIDRMRTLWKKGRNMFQSFFTEAETVKKQIGNDALFASWCFFQLNIDVDTMSAVSVTLRKEDAERVRNDLAAARKAAKDEQAAEAHAEKLKKITMDNEIAAAKAQNALLKAAAEKARAEQDKKAKQKASKETRKAKGERGGSVHALTDEQKVMAARLHFDEGKSPMHIHGVLTGNPNPTRVGNNLEAFLATEKTRRELGAPPIDEALLYAGYVESGLAITNRREADQWAYGDLAIQVTALKAYGEAKLATYAEAIGVEFNTLEAYRAVARAWPEKLTRISNWSVARILVNHPDRVAVVAADPYMTVAEARDIMRAYKEPNVIPLVREA